MDGRTCLITGATIRLVAGDPEFRVASGRFYLRAREISPPLYTLDESLQKRLWSASEVLAGLRYSL